MSKACPTAKQAEITKKYYQEQKKMECIIQELDDGNFIVVRKGDQTILKPPQVYSPPNVAGMIGLATKESQQVHHHQLEPQEDQEGEAKEYTPLEAPILSHCLLHASPAALNSVANYHNLFRYPILPSPKLPSLERCQFRARLLQRAVTKFQTAAAESNLVGVATGLANLQYTLSGTILEFGIASIFQTLFEEVHRSNMSKACATAEEAEETRQHYLLVKKMDSYTQQVKPGMWLVCRQDDHRTLDSINYSPADFQHLFIS